MNIGERERERGAREPDPILKLSEDFIAGRRQSPIASNRISNRSTKHTQILLKGNTHRATSQILIAQMRDTHRSRYGHGRTGNRLVATSRFVRHVKPEISASISRSVMRRRRARFHARVRHSEASLKVSNLRILLECHCRKPAAECRVACPGEFSPPPER